MFKILFSIITAVLVSFSAGAETIQLTPENTLTFRGEVNGSSVLKAQMELVQLLNKRGSKDYTIYLVLDTPGGSIDDGEDFIQFAKTVRNLKTISIFAASMGSAIVEALPGERLIAENGIMMFHRAAGGISGQFEDGELESQLEFYKKVVRAMEQRNANRMGLSLMDYKSKVKDEFWTWSQEAVLNGTADRVVSMVCSKELLAQQDVVRIDAFFFSVDLAFSKCPLLRVGTVMSTEAKATLRKMLLEANRQGKDSTSIYFKGIAK